MTARPSLALTASAIVETLEQATRPRPRDPMDNIWCCMNCNRTFRLGTMYLGSTTNSLKCGFCGSENTHPAGGDVKTLDAYHGEIGTRQ